MLRLGYTTKDHKPVELSLDERRQGTYIIGTTGTGKSTLLKNIMYQDLRDPSPIDERPGFCLLDPHGDLIDEILGLVPTNRKDDVILFDPMDSERPFGLNLMHIDARDPSQIQFQIRWVVSTLVSTMERLSNDSWGPRLEHVLRNSLLTALQISGATLVELVMLLSDPKFREMVTKKIDDPMVKAFWTAFPESDRLRYELTSSTINKITPFVTDISMRNIVGQSKNTIDLGEVMNEGKILLVNLSKGDLGEANASLLGSVLVNQIMISAFQRRSIPVKQRRPFHLIVDEFQNFATESFTILQSEARKYAVDVVAAHQFRDQLDQLNMGSTLNVGNMIVFRVNGRDSYSLASQFDNTPPPADTRVEPIYQSYEFKGQDFLIEASLNTGEGKLYQEVELPRRPYSDVEAEMANQLSISPNYQAWCRLIHVPATRGDPPKLVERKIVTEELGTKEWSKEVAEYIRNRSRMLALPREEVERQIMERLANPYAGEDKPVGSAEELSK